MGDGMTIILATQLVNCHEEVPLLLAFSLNYTKRKTPFSEHRDSKRQSYSNSAVLKKLYYTKSWKVFSLALSPKPEKKDNGFYKNPSPPTGAILLMEAYIPKSPGLRERTLPDAIFRRPSQFPSGR